MVSRLIKRYVLVCAALISFIGSADSQSRDQMQAEADRARSDSALRSLTFQYSLQLQVERFASFDHQFNANHALTESVPRAAHTYLRSVGPESAWALSVNETAESRVGKSLGDELLARRFIRQGHPEQALSYLNSEIQVAKETGDPLKHATALRTRADAYLSLGEFTSAANQLDQAVRMLDELGDTKDEANSLVSLGWTYQSIGDLSQTFSSYDHALKLFAKLSDKDGQVRVRMAAGSLYRYLGKPVWAFQQYKAAWPLASDYQRAWMLASNAEMLIDLNDYSGASAHYAEASKLINRKGDLSFEAAILAGEARAEFMGSTDYLNATRHAKSALSKMREAHNRAGEAAVLATLGEAHYWTAVQLPDEDPHKQLKLALRDYSAALPMMREVGDRSGEIGVLTDTGMLYDEWGKREEALSYYRQALNKLEDLQTSTRLEEFRTDVAEQSAALYERATALSVDFHQDEEAFNLSERARARALLDQLGNPRFDLNRHAPANFTAHEEALRGENIALRRRLAEELTKAGGEIDQEKVSSTQFRLAVIHKQYEDLITQLKLSNPEDTSFFSVSPLKITELQAQLGADVTLVSYYTTPSVNIAFVVTQHEFRAINLPATEEEISAATATLLDFAGDQNSPSLMQLYQCLIAPIRSELKTPMLAIAPYGVLHDLPFAALTPDGKRYLNDDYTVFVLPSASAWPYVRARVKPGNNRALILANDHVSGQATLPHAYEEANAVASLLNTTPKLGTEATGEVLKSEAGESEIVHLVGHISPDKESPGFSEVVVGGNTTDSALQLNDVLNLRLDKTNLVVLSGCLSNSGKRSRADDVSSLSSAFLYAGTPSVVASLWSVDDAATKELMVAFYTHLKDGIGKAEALRTAQQEVRRSHPNPYYWAGFVLTGDPGATSTSTLVARSSK